MTTEELYYKDTHITEFQGSVISCVPNEKGGGYQAVLDRTAFFPEQGGQKADRGTLGGAEVLDVRIKNGIITHILDRPLTEGAEVTGKVDWERRFDFMQQHTGEHIFSGLVHQRFGFDNVGFRLSENLTQLDFSGAITAEELSEIELAVNEAVWKDIPVKVWYPEPEVLKDLEYRSKLELTHDVRIVEIPGVDRCACCAPHLESTGKVGLVKIVSAQNYKGGVRIYIVCGKRALADYGKRLESVQNISVLLSAKQEEICEAVSSLKTKEGETEQKLRIMEEKLLHAEAERLPAPEESRNAVLFAAGLDPNVMRREVNELSGRYSGISAVFAGTDAEGYRFVLGSGSLDCRGLLPELRKQGFKCGGGKEQLQGSAALPEQKIREILDTLSFNL